MKDKGNEIYEKLKKIGNNLSHPQLSSHSHVQGLQDPPSQENNSIFLPYIIKLQKRVASLEERHEKEIKVLQQYFEKGLQEFGKAISNRLQGKKEFDQEKYTEGIIKILKHRDKKLKGYINRTITKSFEAFIETLKNGGIGDSDIGAKSF